MEASVLNWLDSVSGFAFRTSAIFFVVLNVAAIGAMATVRSRSLVQRWTSPWLAANLFLIGAGAGVPAMAYLARITVQAMGSAASVAIGVTK